MPLNIWPLSDSAVMHLPIGRAVSIPAQVLDGSGESLPVSGASYSAKVYTKLSRTLACTGSVTVDDAPTGLITIRFTAAQTALGDERKHYYWVLDDTTAEIMLLDGPVYFHLPGNTPQSPYRGRVVVSVLSSLT